MAKDNGTTVTVSVDALEKLAAVATEKMKSGNTKAARAALAAEGDLVNLRRIEKRFKEGYYSKFE